MNSEKKDKRIIKRERASEKRKRKSIIIDWLWSYLVVLCIPLIAIGIHYSSSIKIVKSEILQANEFMLDNLKNEIDLYLSESIKAYHTFCLDAYFKKWRGDREKNTAFRSDAYKVMEQINSYTKFEPDLSCMMYREDVDYLIQNQGGGETYNLYGGRIWRYGGMAKYEEWLELLKGDYNNEFLVTEYLHYNTNEECIVYADSLIKDDKPKANIFISFPLAKVEELAKGLKDGACLIMSIDGHAQAAWGAKGTTNIPINITNWINFDGEGAYEEEHYMAIVRKSEQEPISYCLMVPKSEFWQEAKQIRNIFFLSLIATMVVALGTIAMLIKRNYQPVSKLLQKVFGSYHRNNEFLQMEEFFCQMKSEKRFLQKRVEDQAAALLSNYLLAMMKGRRPEFSKTEKEFFGIDENRDMILLTVSVPYKDEEAFLHDELLFFVIDNIFSELMNPEEIHRIDDGNFLFYLIPVGGQGEEDNRKKCEESISLCNTFLEEQWDISIVSYVCEREGKIGEIQLLYRESMEYFRRYELTVKKVRGEDIGYNETNETVKAVLVYVDENYQNPNLDINAIAESIGRNPKYLSRVFKQVTKKSILEYITTMRMWKAQELLKMEELSIEEVVQKCGYTNNQTFRRAFVKFTGDTPSKYLQKLKAEKELPK